MSRINGDEGELDALATYLEAVQVFLRQHIHSRNDICCSTSFHLHMRDRHLHATRPVGQKYSDLARPPERVGWAASRTPGISKRHLRHGMVRRESRKLALQRLCVCYEPPLVLRCPHR